jgi:hypothetical protein
MVAVTFVRDSNALVRGRGEGEELSCDFTPLEKGILL